MANKIKLSYKGFRQLRTSAPAEALVERAAKKASDAAGPEFEAQRAPGKNRARWVVVPTTADAALETARNPAHLVRSLNAARD